MIESWRLPFVRLAVEGPEEAGPLLHPLWRELCALPDTEAGGGAAPLELHLQVCAGPLAPAGGEGWSPVFPGEAGRLLADLEGGRFLVGAGPARVLVDPAARRAELGLGGLAAFAGVPHWRGRRLLTDTLLALLAREPCFSLHGALLSRHGEGLVVAAPRGAGKTTFALGLAESGWRLHTDDYALVRGPAPAALASGLRRLVHVGLDTMERFSGIVARRLGLRNLTGDKEGVELGIETPPSLLLAEVPVRWILFLERGEGAASTWEPLLVREALPRLLGQSLAFGTGGPARFETLVAMARQARLLRVTGGRDLLGSPGAAAALLAEVQRDAKEGK